MFRYFFPFIYTTPGKHMEWGGGRGCGEGGDASPALFIKPKKVP